MSLELLASVNWLVQHNNPLHLPKACAMIPSEWGYRGTNVRSRAADKQVMLSSVPFGACLLDSFARGGKYKFVDSRVVLLFVWCLYEVFKTRNRPVCRPSRSDLASVRKQAT